MKKEFSCDNSPCNHVITAVSPDDHHTEFVIKPCCDQCEKRQYPCENCDFVNIRYWCHIHPFHAVGPITGSFKSDLLKDRDIYGATF